MTDKEPPSPFSGPSDTERAEFRRAHFDRTVKRLTVDHVQPLGGRVFESAEEAHDEGFEAVQRNVPRATVFNEMGPALLRERGQANWAVSYVIADEDRRISHEVLDVWATESDHNKRLIPSTGAVLSLVVSRPSESIIDK